MGVKWTDKITNEEFLHRANLPCMADILIERNLRGWDMYTGWGNDESQDSCYANSPAKETEI